MLDFAKEASIYVIARPGPYCNAETNRGGYALWDSDGSLGVFRASDETYHQAWLPWVTKVGVILSANQVTEDGVASGLKSVGKLMLTKFPVCHPESGRE